MSPTRRRDRRPDRARRIARAPSSSPRPPPAAAPATTASPSAPTARSAARALARRLRRILAAFAGPARQRIDPLDRICRPPLARRRPRRSASPAASARRRRGAAVGEDEGARPAGLDRRPAVPSAVDQDLEADPPRRRATRRNPRRPRVGGRARRRRRARSAPRRRRARRARRAAAARRRAAPRWASMKPTSTPPARTPVGEQRGEEGEIGLRPERRRAHSARAAPPAPRRASAHGRSPWRSSNRSMASRRRRLRRRLDPQAGAGRAQREMRPGLGRKPVSGSSALSRASIAQPSRRISSCRSGSGSPAATRNCHSTRSSPVIASVTGCSTCSRVFISRK